MKKLLIFLQFLFFISSNADELCKKAGNYSIYCYKQRESGKITSCEEAVKSINLKNPQLQKWAKKSCQYGCLSETLHEANQMADLIIKDCEKER